MAKFGSPIGLYSVKLTQFYFSCAVPQTLLRELTAFPQILCLDFRGPTSKGRMGRIWDGKGEKEVGRRGRGEGKRLRPPSPPQ